MKKTADPRALAVKILGEIARKDAYADDSLDRALSSLPKMDERDRALATALVYGVLRKRNSLDSQIALAYGRPLGKLHPVLLDILRVGACQLLFMDKIPGRAAVSEAVNLARKSGHEKAAGLVNAVLRKIAERGFVAPEGLGATEITALECGFPDWLVKMWEAQEGENGAREMARSFGAEPPVFLFVDTRRVTLERAREMLGGPRACGEGVFSPRSLWLSGGGDVRNAPLLREELAFVQGQASQLVSMLLDPRPGWKILDACAAPGLKAANLAILMGDEGKITALDIHPHRVKAIEKTAERLGLASIEARLGDAMAFESDESFDAALVDAPCSGLGVLSHNPERKWRLSPGDMERFPELQAGILKNVAKMVKRGGVLVYATCTTAREENERVIEAFLSSSPGWEFESAEGFAPRALVSPGGFLKTFPRGVPGSPAGHLDGFFAARLRLRK